MNTSSTTTLSPHPYFLPCYIKHSVLPAQALQMCTRHTKLRGVELSNINIIHTGLWGCEWLASLSLTTTALHTDKQTHLCREASVIQYYTRHHPLYLATHCMIAIKNISLFYLCFFSPIFCSLCLRTENWLKFKTTGQGEWGEKRL